MISLILIITISQVFCQDCREYSETCSDSKDCCGGCCINQVCVDTYHDCRLKEDPCMEQYCPPDTTCEVFHPEDCPGCDISKRCISLNEDTTKNVAKINEQEIHNTSNQIKYSYLLCFIVVFYYFIL